MKRHAGLFLAAVAISLAALVSIAAAQDIIIYKEGANGDQQLKDRSECDTWATQQLGYNPAYQSPPDSGPDGSRLRGAARGAAAGAVIGEIADNDAGKGAAWGAAGGAVLGGARRRQARRAQEAQMKQMQENHRRAAGTCLQGRGYSVSY